MAASDIPSTDACDEQMQPPQFIPEWRAICSGAAYNKGKIDATAASSTASPASESSRNISPSEETSPIGSGFTSPAGCSTTAAAQSSDESDSEVGRSAEERTSVDGDDSDGELMGIERESTADFLEGPRLVKALTQILINLANESDVQGCATERGTSFHASRRPHLSIGLYLDRIYEYLRCSKQCFVVGLVYIDRVLKSRPDFVFNELSSHRLLFASMVVAAKFQDDVHHSNAYYANVGGLSLQSLNRLEKDLLHIIGWQVYVSADEYDQYLDVLEHVNVGDV